MTEPEQPAAQAKPGADDPAVAALAAAAIGEVRADASLADLTTLRVGGPARILLVAERDEDLAAAGQVARDHALPWAIIGRGSNLLVSDAGWPGIAITLGRGFRGVAIEDGLVRAGAAEPLPTLAMRIADAGLAGAAWTCAVPGTLGGAVRMNAGAHGSELVEILVEAEIVRLRSGVRETWPRETLGLSYRSSTLPDDAVVVGATLALDPGDPATIRAQITEIRAWRRTHQPLNEPNCGSVFTNPPGDSAGRLIEVSGAKGLVVGEARISERHANFIVTRPQARASDVHQLITMVQQRVRETTGVELIPEVSRLGAFPDPDLSPDAVADR